MDVYMYVWEKGREGAEGRGKRRNWGTGREIEGPDLQSGSATCTTEYNIPLNFTRGW